MPFVKISALKEVHSKDEVMKNVERALYKCEYRDKPLVPVGMATCLWQTLDSVVHKNEAYVVHKKSLVEIPVFVDLYINSSFNEEGVYVLTKTIANAISETGEINIENVFIHVHVGKPGYVFISGHIS